MPVDSKHPLYLRWLPDWRLCEAVCEGERSVKDKALREEVLPKLSGHRKNPKDYDVYVAHAYFFPAVARYLEGVLGLLFQTEPQVEAPSQMKAFLADVTGSDHPCSIQEYVKAKVGRELARTGRCGTLIDFPLRDVDAAAEDEAVLPRDLTRGQAERRGVLPTFTLYKARDIINWRERRIGGRTVTSLLVLHEMRQVKGEDEFSHEQREQWRVFDLVPPTPEQLRALPLERRVDGLVCRARIFRLVSTSRKKKREFVQVGSDRFPRIAGVPLTEIPFEFHGAKDADPDPQAPPLLDLVTISVSILRNSAMLEHGALFVGSPQPYITGYDEEEELGIVEHEMGDGDADEFAEDVPATRQYLDPRDESHDVKQWKLGASTVLLVKSAEATPGVLSVKSEDMSLLRELIREKKEDLVAIGGRLLARDKLAAEAARTEEIRREGERSIVANLAGVIQASVTRALVWARSFLGASGTVECTVDVAFMAMMSPSDALAVADLFLGGHIARSDEHDLFRRGRIIRPERTTEAILEELRRDPPGTLPGVLGGNPALPPGGPDEGEDGDEEAGEGA